MRIIRSFFLFFIFCSSITIHAQTELWGAAQYGGQQFGTIYGVVPGDTVISHQYDLKGTYGSIPEFTKMIQASNGMLYGVIRSGGESFIDGMLFEYNPVTSVYTKKFDFNVGNVGTHPYGGLLEAPNGKLYGLLYSGGASGLGTLYEFDPLTSACVIKVNFSGTANGAAPYGSLILASNGLLYGMTTSGGVYSKGTVFEYDLTSNTLTKKIDFNPSVNGSNPYGDLVEASNGKLYGLTKEGGSTGYGTLFEFDISTSILTKKVDFTGLANGKWPYGSLIQAADGYLYGLTSEGGGTTNGTLFRFDISIDTFTKMMDLPMGGPVKVMGSFMEAQDGKLYGLSFSGGSAGAGVVFSYTTSTNTLTTLASLTGTTGCRPESTLMQTTDGKIFGLGSAGGFANAGTLFEFDLLTNVVSPKVHFDYAPDGKYPNCGLVKATNGLFYGTTFGGGLSPTGDGVIFEYNPLSDVYTRKFSFTNTSTGRQPICQMISATNGKLYGITWYGGSYSQGVLYEFDPVTSVFTKRHDFAGISGAHPQGSLIQASNGKIYGVTPEGGSSGKGVLFEFNPVTNVYTKRVDLNGTIGGNAYGRLVQAGDGNLYGIANSGGLSNYGVIFQFNTTTNTYLKKLDLFSSAIGHGSPFGMTLGTNGNLYGATYGGGSTMSGQLFEYNFTSNVLTKHFDFALATGQNPYAEMSLASNGRLYGTTERGGNLSVGMGGIIGYGVLYEFDPVSLTYTDNIAFVPNAGHQIFRAPLMETPCLPTVTMLPVSDTICSGENSGFSVFSNDVGVSYQWQVNTGSGFTNLVESPPYSSTTSPDLLIDSVPAGFNNNQYQCIVTTSAGCSGISNSVILSVNPIPSVSLSVPGDTICMGSNVPVSTSPSGGTLTGNGISGSTFFSGTAGTGSHLIHYAYTDANGCENADSLFIFVDVCSGLNSVHSSDKSFDIFPNPSNGKFMIHQNTLSSGTVSVHICTVLGNVVYVVKDLFGNKKQKKELDLTFLSPGVYFITINSEEASFSEKLIIK